MMDYSFAASAVVGMWGALFCLFYFSFRVIFINAFKVNWGAGDGLRGNLKAATPHNDRLLYYTYVALIVFSVILSMHIYFHFNFISMLNSTWAGRRAEVASPMAELALYYAYMAACGSLIYYHLAKKRRKALLYLCIISLVYFSLVIKTKAYLVYMIIPFLVYYYLNRDAGKRRYVILMTMVASFLFLYLLVRFARHIGDLHSLSLYGGSIVSTVMGTDTGEFSLISAFFSLVQSGNNNPSFDANHSLIRMLMVFVPSSLGGSIKPEGMAYTIWDAYIGVKGVGGSYPATIIGDSYFNDFSFGYIIYPFFYAFVFSAIEKFSLHRRYMRLPVFALFCPTVLTMVRGSVYNGFSVLMFCFIFWLIVDLVSRTGILFKRTITERID